MSDPTAIVSACLLGFPCRHDGADKLDPRVLSALAGHALVPVCPEVAGGLPIPRPPAWQDGARVLDAQGRDVTLEFSRGASIAVESARNFGATLAVLKQNSPSCGTVLTGTAQGRRPGMGLAARALAEAGLVVRGEDATW